MQGINKILLIGTVGCKPETRYIQKGVSFSKFSLATTEDVMAVGGRLLRETEWHEIVVYRQLSDFVAQYVKKGDTLYVEGRIKSRYVSDGGEAGHRVYEVIANQVRIISRSLANANTPIPNSENQEPQQFKIGCALPGIDIENIPVELKGDGDNLPF